MTKTTVAPHGMRGSLRSPAKAYADADQTEVVADGSTSFGHSVQGMVGTTDAGVPRAYVRTPDGMRVCRRELP